MAERRLHLVLRDVALRNVLATLLRDDGWQVVAARSLPETFETAANDDVVVVDWTASDGFLNEQRNPALAELQRRARVVVLVPRRWTRQLSAHDLGVAALVPKPFDFAALRSTLAGATAALEDGTADLTRTA